MSASIGEIDFEKQGGLVPVIVQSVSGSVLMLAYANREAVELTMSTGYAHFWSRSRKKIWKKGEESGNYQLVKEILVDCDFDSLIYVVQEKGPACHTGNYTCFFRKITR